MRRILIAFEWEPNPTRPDQSPARTFLPQLLCSARLGRARSRGSQQRQDRPHQRRAGRPREPAQAGCASCRWSGRFWESGGLLRKRASL